MRAKSLSFLFTIYSTSKYLLFGRLQPERYYNDDTKIKPAHASSNYPQYIYILRPYILPSRKMNDVHDSMNEQLIIILQV